MFKIIFGKKIDSYFKVSETSWEYGEDWPGYIVQLEKFFEVENCLLDIIINKRKSDFSLNLDVRVYWEDILWLLGDIENLKEGELYFSESDIKYLFSSEDGRLTINYKDWEKEWEETIEEKLFFDVWLGFINEIHKRAKEGGYLKSESAIKYLNENLASLDLFSTTEVKETFIRKLCEPFLDSK